MQIVKINNPFCNETIYATIRITDEEFAKLKWFMRNAEPVHYKGKNVCFPFGVELIKTGYGWAKLMPMNFKEGVKKIHFATKRCLAEYEEYLYNEQLEETRRLAHANITATQVVAYSNSHSDGEFIFASKQEQQRKGARAEAKTAALNAQHVKYGATVVVDNQPKQQNAQLSEHGVAKLQRLASKFGHNLRK